MFITLIAASSNINFMRQFSSVEVLFQAEIKSYMLCSDIQDKLCGRDWENSIDLMFFILAVSNYEEYQYMVDILTLNATQYFSNGIVYENINECVANIGGKEEVHLDFVC